MKMIKGVVFNDENRIEYELLIQHLHENKQRRLIAGFRGQYRLGCQGSRDACVMHGLTIAIARLWAPDQLILDLSRLEYEWGDEMDMLIRPEFDRGIPAAIVVGTGSARAVATLIWGAETRRSPTEMEHIFDSVAAAEEYLETMKG